MLNAPDTNFISSLRKNFINFANDRIQRFKNLIIPRYAVISRPLAPIRPKTHLQNT